MVNTYYALTLLSTKPHGKLKATYNTGRPKINVPDMLREPRGGVEHSKTEGFNGRDIWVEP